MLLSQFYPIKTQDSTWIILFMFHTILTSYRPWFRWILVAANLESNILDLAQKYNGDPRKLAVRCRDMVGEQNPKSMWRILLMESRNLPSCNTFLCNWLQCHHTYRVSGATFLWYCHLQYKGTLNVYSNRFLRLDARPRGSLTIIYYGKL